MAIDENSRPPGADEQVSFGDEMVPAGEKAGRVRAVFDSVAPRYDLMNDLMSGGMHRVWKSVLLDRLAPQPGQVLLDVAGGTGDIARGFLDRAASRPKRGRPEAQAIVCDINHAMMRAGKEDGAQGDLGADQGALTWVTGDAENLPLPDRTVDRVTIGFGIRNVTHRERALSEMVRVLRPGGRFVCMEFSRPITEGFDAVYQAYSDAVIPTLGDWVTGDRESYRYLVESIRRFPPQEAFAAEVRRAGLSRVTVENLTGGIVALHSGWKI